MLMDAKILHRQQCLAFKHSQMMYQFCLHELYTWILLKMWNQRPPVGMVCVSQHLYFTVSILNIDVSNTESMCKPIQKWEKSRQMGNTYLYFLQIYDVFQLYFCIAVRTLKHGCRGYQICYFHIKRFPAIFKTFLKPSPCSTRNFSTWNAST